MPPPRPSDRSVRGATDLRPGPGYQHHHIIPLALGRRPQIGHFLNSLGTQGFGLHDRARNCLWLPADEALAWDSGSALHRGPHPRYTDVVAARIDRIRRTTAALPERQAKTVALRRIDRLQRALTHVLAGTGPRLVQLNRRDPMHLFNDYSYLDSAIAELDLSLLLTPASSPLNGGG